LDNTTNTTTSEVSYTFDDYNNRQTKSDTITGETISYTYDKNNRLQTETKPIGIIRTIPNRPCVSKNKINVDFLRFSPYNNINNLRGMLDKFVIIYVGRNLEKEG
jgi:YD repeat-containing protein